MVSGSETRHEELQATGAQISLMTGEEPTKEEGFK
jgi:hypothetical protein